MNKMLHYSALLLMAIVCMTSCQKENNLHTTDNQVIIYVVDSSKIPLKVFLDEDSIGVIEKLAHLTEKCNGITYPLFNSVGTISFIPKEGRYMIAGMYLPKENITVNGDSIPNVEIKDMGGKALDNGIELFAF